jgi:hypothetical protein
MAKVVLVTILLCLLQACSTTIFVSSANQNEFNEKAAVSNATIVLISGDTLNAYNVEVIADSLQWQNRLTLEPNQLPRWKVETVTLSSSSVGAFDGALFGTILGGLIGAAIPYPPPQGIQFFPPPSNHWMEGALIGACAGATSGALIGHEYLYRFPVKSNVQLGHGGAAR